MIRHDGLSLLCSATAYLISSVSPPTVEPPSCCEEGWLRSPRGGPAALEGRGDANGGEVAYGIRDGGVQWLGEDARAYVLSGGR